MRVAPFGDPWINAHLRLPTAYRSLSRPSSAPSAKASALRPSSLDHAAKPFHDLFLLCGPSKLLLTKSLHDQLFDELSSVSPDRPPVSPGCLSIRYL